MAYPKDENSIIMEHVHVYLVDRLADSSVRLNDSKMRIRQLADSADHMIATVTGWFLGSKFPDRSEVETFSYPDGPWEAWKDKYAPKWFTEKWPVKMKEVSYESARYHYNVCPHWHKDMDSDEKWKHFRWMGER